MPLNDSSLGRLSRATPLTLTEITFRPYSAHCYSFTAVVRDGYNGRGVSLAQVIRLIASTGHVGKINNYHQANRAIFISLKWLQLACLIPALVQWHGSINYRGGRP